MDRPHGPPPTKPLASNTNTDKNHKIKTSFVHTTAGTDISEEELTPITYWTCKDTAYNSPEDIHAKEFIKAAREDSRAMMRELEAYKASLRDADDADTNARTAQDKQLAEILAQIDAFKDIITKMPASTPAPPSDLPLRNLPQAPPAAPLSNLPLRNLPQAPARRPMDSFKGPASGTAGPTQSSYMSSYAPRYQRSQTYHSAPEYQDENEPHDALEQKRKRYQEAQQKIKNKVADSRRMSVSKAAEDCLDRQTKAKEGEKLKTTVVSLPLRRNNPPLSTYIADSPKLPVGPIQTRPAPARPLDRPPYTIKLGSRSSSTEAMPSTSRASSPKKTSVPKKTSIVRLKIKQSSSPSTTQTLTAKHHEHHKHDHKDLATWSHLSVDDSGTHVRTVSTENKGHKSGKHASSSNVDAIKQAQEAILAKIQALKVEEGKLQRELWAAELLKEIQTEEEGEGWDFC